MAKITWVSLVRELSLTPPVGSLLTMMFGFCLLILIPIASNSLWIFFFYSFPLSGSKMIRIKSDALATAKTYLPLPLPCAAPSMIPGRSSNQILALLQWMTPGIHVSVVKWKLEVAETVSVILDKRLDFPTEGKPTRETRAFPYFCTANPSPSSKISHSKNLKMSDPKIHSASIFVKTYTFLHQLAPVALF